MERSEGCLPPSCKTSSEHRGLGVGGHGLRHVSPERRPSRRCRTLVHCHGQILQCPSSASGQRAQRTDKAVSKAPAWANCMGFTIPKRALKEEKTSVTPQLLPIFEGSYFSEFLQSLETVPLVQKKIEA